jgi:hypothetical protein
MQDQELIRPGPSRSAPRPFLRAVVAALRAALRRAKVPDAADLPPHVRRDVGLPPEVPRPSQAPPRVF